MNKEERGIFMKITIEKDDNAGVVLCMLDKLCNMPIGSLYAIVNSSLKGLKKIPLPIEVSLDFEIDNESRTVVLFHINHLHYPFFTKNGDVWESSIIFKNSK